MPKAKAVVLVVEDDAIIRIGALDLVQRAGFEAIEAGNADEAIKILEARSVASGRTIVEQSRLPEGAQFFGKPYNEADLVQSIIRMVA